MVTLLTELLILHGLWYAIASDTSIGLALKSADVNPYVGEVIDTLLQETGQSPYANLVLLGAKNALEIGSAFFKLQTTMPIQTSLVTS